MTRRARELPTAEAICPGGRNRCHAHTSARFTFASLKGAAVTGLFNRYLPVDDHFNRSPSRLSVVTILT